MPTIYPKMAAYNLRKSVHKRAQGQGRVALPSVKSDAKHQQANDKCGYQANRELAPVIRKPVRAKKKTDVKGMRFVLGWRLDPNGDHPYWTNKDVHSCGCACSG